MSSQGDAPTSSLEKQRQAHSSKEAQELTRAQEPTCFCLTAKADRSLTSTLSKPDTLRCMLDPKSLFMQRWDNFIKLGRRTERFELNLQRAKSMVENGFERIELHLEAQYKVFQDIIRKADREEKRAQERKD